MNTNNHRILFLLDRIKINNQGKCPIRCRITYLQEKKIFSTGLFINPNYWDNKTQKAKPPKYSRNISRINFSLHFAN